MVGSSRTQKQNCRSFQRLSTGFCFTKIEQIWKRRIRFKFRHAMQSLAENFVVPPLTKFENFGWHNFQKVKNPENPGNPLLITSIDQRAAQLLPCGLNANRLHCAPSITSARKHPIFSRLHKVRTRFHHWTLQWEDISMTRESKFPSYVLSKWLTFVIN